MKYQVTYYYHSSVTVEVEADCEEEAIELGYDVDANDQIISNLQEDGDPDVEEADD